MIARVKGFKAGFVVSASNLTPEATLQDGAGFEGPERLLHRGHHPRRHGHRQAAWASSPGRDYRVSRMSPTEKVADFMTPREKLITAPADTTLKEANDIIWANKLNSLPIVDKDDRMMYFVLPEGLCFPQGQPPGAAGQQQALPGGGGHQYP